MKLSQIQIVMSEDKDFGVKVWQFVILPIYKIILSPMMQRQLVMLQQHPFIL